MYTFAMRQTLVHLDPWKQSGLTLCSGCMVQYEIQNNCALNIKFRTPTYYKYWIILHMDPGHRPVGGGSPCIRKHIKYPPQGITYDLYRCSHSDVPCLAIIFHRWQVSLPGMCGVMRKFDQFWHLRTNCVCGHPVYQSQHATRDLSAREYDVLNVRIDPSICILCGFAIHTPSLSIRPTDWDLEFRIRSLITVRNYLISACADHTSPENIKRQCT